jgi:capsule polysaccharide export protein KpsC/LpsZ
MLNNTVIHYGYLQKTELNLVKAFAEEFDLDFIHEGIRKLSVRNPKFPNRSYIAFIKKAKYANFIFIWNGMQCYGPLITRFCKEKNIPKCYMEWGMLPQSKNFFIDPLGFCGDSILNKDLSWINSQDMDKLYSVRKSLQKEYTIKDSNYILVPLQLENDTQILYYSKYRNMIQFIEDVLNKYPQHKIVIKPHPKEDNTEQYLKLLSKYSNLLMADKTDSFMNLASKASFVVGITSTTLYEAGILGKKVISLGNHPISNNIENNIDKVLAGALVLNIDRETGNIRQILERFNINPL